MPRHVDMQDAAPIVGEDDEDEQDPAGERRHREEVDRDGRAEMVLEEGAPALRGWLPAASAEKPSAQRPRTPASTIPVVRQNRCDAQPRTEALTAERSAPTIV